MIRMICDVKHSLVNAYAVEVMARSRSRRRRVRCWGSAGVFAVMTAGMGVRVSFTYHLQKTNSKYSIASSTPTQKWYHISIGQSVDFNAVNEIVCTSRQDETRRRQK